MGSHTSLSSSKQQVQYTRRRDDPFFDGMRGVETSLMKSVTLFDIPGKTVKQRASRSAPNIDVEPENSIDVDNVNESEESDTRNTLERPTIERSYGASTRRVSVCNILLPPSAASFYNEYSHHIEVIEPCQSIQKLNSYLKACKVDVSAGVPGRFLRAVMGPDVSDVGSVVSTLAYSFYLKAMESYQFCTVPVISMKRAALNCHAELKWLFDSCNIDQSSLVFLDELDLSYHDLFGGLKLVLVNGSKLPEKEEALKESLVEIFNCRKGDIAYPWVTTVTRGEDCSCCTRIAEKFASTAPELLAGKGFSRLLLAGILMDTANLTSSDCTLKDKYMSTLLINGAGRFGCNGLYQILRYKMHDVSDLRVGEILRKDFRKWTRTGKTESAGSRLMVSHIGMSSIGMSVSQLLAHDENSTQEIMHFQQIEKLRLLTIVSGYYDPQKNFKREILISAESVELLKNLIHFFDSHSSRLPLKFLDQPGLRDEMKAFKVDKVTSRRIIEQLLEEFGA